MFYVSKGRTMAAPRKHFFKYASRALELRFDTPIAQVAHPAAEPEGRGLDENAVPKADPLHQTSYNYVQSSYDDAIPRVIRT